MAAKKWIYEVKYTDGEEYTYTALDGKRYRTAKRYLVWCGPARWSGYQAMLPVAYQLRYRKDGTITHTAILREAKAHCRHEIPLEKVFEEEPRDEAGKTATRE